MEFPGSSIVELSVIKFRPVLALSELLSVLSYFSPPHKRSDGFLTLVRKPSFLLLIGTFAFSSMYYLYTIEYNMIKLAEKEAH